MDIDPTAVIAAVVGGMIALDKAGFWLRKRKGSAAVTKTQLTDALAPMTKAVEKMDTKLDTHGERLAVVEAHIKAGLNGTGI